MSNGTVLQQMKSSEDIHEVVTPSSTPGSKTPIPPPEIVIPDGGLRAWLAVLGGWIVSFCTFGFASSFGVFEDYYVMQGTSSSSNISWIGSLQLFFLFFMGLPAGRLFDRGYFHHITIFGTLLYVFSLFMLSLANPKKYYQLILSQGVGAGLGSGFILVPALSLQAHHWQKRRALAMGIVLTGSSVGGIIYPIMLNQLFKSSVGFAWGVRAATFMTLGLLIIANLSMTTRLPSAKQRPPGSSMPKLSSILTDPPYMITQVGIFLGLWGVFLPYFYLQLWVNLHGLSPNLAFYTIAILNAGSVPGRTLPNFIADYVGRFNMILPVSFCTGGLMFAMFGATTPGAVIVFSILYGFFAGAYIALLPPTLATMAKSADEIGLRIGFGYAFSSFAMLTGTPIDGALLGPDNHWHKPIIFSGVVLLSGSAIMVLGRHILVKRKGTQRI
ncbi:hypothetical protein AcW1_001970 [Taiwanofungus camphoratus]|nr:hypothetical protein AcV5_009966 [Antrodia cinnamomea]KAI0944211.1 hypothetical protein AcW1_001970 [Antrodia cinnamomea]KAI0945848.1 hypothetical protein AcV7_009974 [Antrodia cinnamomea]